MSFLFDAEPVAGVTVGGVDRAGLYYDSVTHLFRYKNQAGVDAALVNGVISFNARTGVVVPVVGDYNTFFPLIGTTLTAGNGLTGGGDLSASRTFTVTSADAGIVVTASGLFYAIPSAGVPLVAASKVYVIGDRSKMYRRSNGGSAMTDTLPTLAVGDNGWTLKVHNEGATATETITFTSPFGNFPNGTTAYVLQYGCRQTFTWTGSSWDFDAGNANLFRAAAAVSVIGNIPSFSDTVSRVLGDSGVSAASVVLNTRTVSTTAPLTGGGALSANLTLAISAATTGAAGSLSAADKTKLDSVASNATVASVGGTAPIVSSGGATPVISINAATTSTAGSLAANDKKKIDLSYYDVVANGGADPTGVVDATTIIQTAVDSFGAAGGRVYFPPGTYKVSTTITISKPVILFGAGRSISVISTTNATTDVFTMASGAQGAGFEQLRIAAASSGLRTAGFAVNFGSQANTYMQQCDIIDHWSGVHSSAALQFIDDMNIRNMGANAANGQCVLIDSTGDRYIRRLTTDNGSNPTGFAGVRVRECSSLVMTDCNIIHAGNALDLVPNAGAGHAIASVDCANCFFDTSVIGCNIVPATGSDTVQRVIFVRCWFSTHTGAGVVINSANVNSVDFCECEFYQNPFGIDVQAATEWSVRASRFAGNTTNGIRTAAGATHSFSITDCVVGNVAGFGANAQGINIQAGTYKRYQIKGNRGLETNTTKGLIDLGVVGASDQKDVSDNMGGLFGGAMATLGAPVASVSTTVSLLLSCRIPANSVKIGDTFECVVFGISSSTGTLIFGVKAGALGTTGDGSAWTSITSAAQVTNQRAGFTALLVVRSIGAGGTVQCEGLGYAQAALLPTVVAAVTTPTVVTTADWFIDIVVTCSVGTFTAQQATISVK